MNANTARQETATPAPRHRARQCATSQTTRTIQVEVLKKLIEQHATVGVERGGHRWAALPQQVLLSEMNARLPIVLRIKVRQFRNLISTTPGIVRGRMLVNGKVTCILRLGEPDEATPDQDATERAVRVLASMWRKRT